MSRDEQLYLAAIINAERVQKLLELRHSTHKPTIRIKSASSYAKDKKPTIYVKSATNYRKEKKLTELGAIIRGTSYPPISIPARTKGASEVAGARKPGPIEREVKLKQLGKLVRGSSSVP